MGRANRLLSRFVDRIALSFSPTKHLDPKAEARAILTGTPVRDAVLAYRNVPYAPPDPVGRLLLLVFGGSQGAQFFSEVMPPALMALPSPLRWRLTIVQQAREEDLERLTSFYKEAEIAAHRRPVLPRPARADGHLAACHCQVGSLDRGRIDGHWPPLPARAAAACP